MSPCLFLDCEMCLLTDCSQIPGKPREPLNFAGGIPLYVKMLRESLDNDYKGFEVA